MEKLTVTKIWFKKKGMTDMVSQLKARNYIGFSELCQLFGLIKHKFIYLQRIRLSTIIHFK